MVEVDEDGTSMFQILENGLESSSVEIDDVTVILNFSY